MKQEDKIIEIPFGAFDSELGDFEYTIPDGYEAEIKDGKVIVRKSESENEKIRKEFIFYINSEIPQCSIQEHAAKLKEFVAWLEKQGEQKPADKVEPKFHKDDWIMHQGTENIYQVVAVIDNQYQLKYGDNYTIQYCEDVDRCARLWDITKDAKDGDVLAAHECIVLFKEIDGLNIKCHCTYHFMNNPSLYINTLQNKTAFYPATKEQRDILMKAMTDAGYTFNFEKKELKKIKQKAAWSKEDDEMLDSIIEEVRYIGDFPDYPTREEDELYDECLAKVNWLKSLKDRVVPQPKQEWSEEDSLHYTNILQELEHRKGCYSDYDRIVTVKSDINWLKSLRPQKQWKPTEEQLEALQKVISGFASVDFQVLKRLHTELKAL